MIRLNLGSGQRKFGTPTAPWVNVDISAKHSPDICADSEQFLQTLADASAELIVCHHTLEHYSCGEADELVRECRRVLTPGGSLLVFVPDMEKLVSMWIEGKMDRQVFLTNVYGAYQGEEGDRHRWGFTRRSLVFMLHSLEFKRVQDFDYREIAGADLARDDRWILGMEAVK